MVLARIIWYGITAPPTLTVSKCFDVPGKTDILLCKFREVDTTSLLAKYGALYNFYSVTDARGIAATGWRVPAITDYQYLSLYIGGFLGGGKLTQTGFDYWVPPNDGAVNQFNFNATGSGTRTYTGGDFADMNKNCNLITCSDAGYGNYHYVQLVSGRTWFNIGWAFNYNNGGTARVLKNAPTADDLLLPDGYYGGSYTGNDGKQYATVKIGIQVWLAENLCETKYRDGSLIPIVTDNTAWAALTTGAMCYYNNDINNAFSQAYIPYKVDKILGQLRTVGGVGTFGRNDVLLGAYRVGE